MSQKVTKKQAVQLLKDYFRASETRRKAGLGEIFKELSYTDVVLEMNKNLQRIELIASQLDGVELETINI